MNKNGFTLVELLVYMAIVGIVVIIAGQAFGDSTKVRIRTQNMIKANKVAEDVGVIFRDDLAQMGAKMSKNLKDELVLSNDVYMNKDAGDLSSFNSIANQAGTDLDRIDFRRLAFNGERVLRVEEISWFVRGKKLFRACRTISGTADDVHCPAKQNAEVEIADGVEAFVVTPARPGISGGNLTLFPVNAAVPGFRLISVTGNDDIVPLSADPASGATIVNLSGFTTNYNEDEHAEPSKFFHQVVVKGMGEVGDDWTSCKKFNFKKDSTYEISFTMPYNEDASRMFQPSKDHFSLGIRQIEGKHMLLIDDVPDFYFAPPVSSDGIGSRKMRFSTHIKDFKDVCLAFTFANYSPSVSSGTVSIGNLKVQKIADENYSFSNTFRLNDFTNEATYTDKANIRAFRMRFVVKKNGEEGETIITVPVPSNGTKKYEVSL